MTWTEHGALPGPVVISVNGINQDEQDKLELQNFTRGLSAPAKEDPGGKAYAPMRGLAMTPLDTIRVVCAIGGGLYLAFTALSLWAVSSGWPAGSWATRNPLVSFCASASALTFGLVGPRVVRFLRVKRAAPVRRITPGIFELRFDGGHFACSGAGTPEVRIELARVRSFTGGRRLSVELTDAPTATLSLSVPSRDNTPLAARLNDLLAASRAATSRAW